MGRVESYVGVPFAPSSVKPSIALRIDLRDARRVEPGSPIWLGRRDQAETYGWDEEAAALADSHVIRPGPRGNTWTGPVTTLGSPIDHGV